MIRTRGQLSLNYLQEPLETVSKSTSAQYSQIIYIDQDLRKTKNPVNSYYGTFLGKNGYNQINARKVVDSFESCQLWQTSE